MVNTVKCEANVFCDFANFDRNRKAKRPILFYVAYACIVLDMVCSMCVCVSKMCLILVHNNSIKYNYKHFDRVQMVVVSREYAFNSTHDIV